MEAPGVPVQRRGLQGAQGNPYVGLVFVAAAAVAIGVALCLLHRRVTRQFEERHGYQHGPDHHDQLGKLGSMVRDLAEGVSFKLGRPREGLGSPGADLELRTPPDRRKYGQLEDEEEDEPRPAYQR